MSEITLRVSADPWALEGPVGLVRRPQTMKNQEILIMDETLIYINLSHVDFLDDPVAIHCNTLMFSRSTNNASPNELINPEILMKNRPNRTYSFAWSWPAIFPAMIIPLVPV